MAGVARGPNPGALVLPMPPRGQAPRGGSFPSYPAAASSPGAYTPPQTGAYGAPPYDPGRYPPQASNPGSYSAAPAYNAAPQPPVQGSNPGSFSAAPAYSAAPQPAQTSNPGSFSVPPAIAAEAPPLTGSQSVPLLPAMGGPPTDRARNGLAPSSGRPPVGPPGEALFRGRTSSNSAAAQAREEADDPFSQHHIFYTQTRSSLNSLEEYTRHLEKANMRLKAKLLQVVKPTLVALFSRQEAVIKTMAFSYWKRYTHEHSVQFWKERYNEDKAALKREFQAAVSEVETRIEEMQQKNRDSEEQLTQAIAYAEELENDKEAEKTRVVGVQAQLGEAEKCIEKLRTHTMGHLDDAGKGGARYEKAKKQFADEEVIQIERRQENIQNGFGQNRPSTGELQSIKDQLDLLFQRINGADQT